MFLYLNLNTLLSVIYKFKIVDIGFWKGNQIQIHQDHLVTENRKMMVSLRYQTQEDINDAVLIDVLKEAQKLY